MAACAAWVVAGCAEGSAAKPAATPAGAQVVQTEAAPPATDDGRFAQDVPAEPPPRPVREIDRDDKQPATAELNKQPARQLDKTLEATGEGGGGGTTQADNEVAHDNAMLVYTAQLTMSVYQVGPAIDAIEVIGRSFGGYLSKRDDNVIVIRVPRARFSDALHKVEAQGDVLHRQIAAEDVTDQFVDMETRLRNARAVRDRLESLLQKAAVKEAIEIQRELERVTGEIESLEGKLKVLKDRVAYSVIAVTFEARGDAAIHEKLRLPFPWLQQLGLPHLLNLGGE